MPAALLDTDVFSFFFKRDTRADFYEPALSGMQLCLSFQSVAELRLWALIRRWGDQRCGILEQAFTRYVVLPYDDALSHHWANLTSLRRRIGRPIECGDAWIAATALRHNAVLLTHNGSHYSDIPDLRIVSYRS